MHAALIIGLASIYWPQDGRSGSHRADGAALQPQQCHVAHRTLPMRSKLRICSLRTKRCVVAVVADRGPWGQIQGSLDRWHRCRRRAGCRWRAARRLVTGYRWRAEVDMSRCVARAIGHQQLGLVSLERL